MGAERELGLAPAVGLRPGLCHSSLPRAGLESCFARAARSDPALPGAGDTPPGWRQMLSHPVLRRVLSPWLQDPGRGSRAATGQAPGAHHLCPPRTWQGSAQHPWGSAPPAPLPRGPQPVARHRVHHPHRPAGHGHAAFPMPGHR